MNDPLQSALRRRADKSPKPLTLAERASMWLIGPGGWAMRQGMKFITNASVAVSTALTAHGVPSDKATAIALGFVAACSWLLEMILSRLAAKMARQAEPIED